MQTNLFKLKDALFAINMLGLPIDLHETICAICRRGTSLAGGERSTGVQLQDYGAIKNPIEYSVNL